MQLRSKVSIRELEAHLREHVLATHIPTHWRFVEALPRTPYGKVVKGELRDGYPKDRSQ